MSSEHTYPAYVTDHAAAAEEIGRLSWLLAQVVELVDRPGENPTGQLRRIAEQARCRPSVQRAAALDAELDAEAGEGDD